MQEGFSDGFYVESFSNIRRNSQGRLQLFVRHGRVHVRLTHVSSNFTTYAFVALFKATDSLAQLSQPKNLAQKPEQYFYFWCSRSFCTKSRSGFRPSRCPPPSRTNRRSGSFRSAPSFAGWHHVLVVKGTRREGSPSVGGGLSKLSPTPLLPGRRRGWGTSSSGLAGWSGSSRNKSGRRHPPPRCLRR